jgi:hypothetical protein
LLYGDPGVGKTTLIGSAADHEVTSPVLLIDIEGGTLAVRNKKIDVKTARSLPEVQRILNTLIKRGDDLYYKTVALDSLTELQKLDMRFIMRQEKANAKNPDSVDIDVPTQRAWGKSLEHTRAIVRAFRDLPCNTIITALAGRDKDDNNVVTDIYPSVPGKARNEVPGFMDIVGYYYATQRGNTLVRRLQFAKTSRVLAKDRTSLLGEAIDDPTFPQLFDMIHS